LNGWLDELRGNARLRAGALLIVGLLWTLLLFEGADRIDALRRERVAVVDEIDRLRGVIREAGWLQRRDDAQQLLAVYRGRAWREESEGRMQALMQDWLREKLAGAGVQPAELTVSVLAAAQEGAAGAALPAEFRLVRSRVTFDFQPQTLHELLASVAANPNWVAVSRLAVRNTGRRVVELELEALFVLGARAGS
jgi:hypothetical protein